jgi:hypothetical protein
MEEDQLVLSLSYTVLGINLFLIPGLVGLVWLKLFRESLLVLGLLIISSFHYVCLIEEDSCLTLSPLSWEYGTATYTFLFIYLVIFSIINWDEEDKRWTIIFALHFLGLVLVKTFAQFFIFLLSSILVTAYSIQIIQKDEMVKVKWRLFLPFLAFVIVMSILYQLLRREVWEVVWYAFSTFLFLLKVLSRIWLERKKARMLRGVMVRTLDHVIDVTRDLSTRKQDCLLSCSDRCGEKASDLLLALLAGDNYILDGEKLRLQDDIELGTGGETVI